MPKAKRVKRAYKRKVKEVEVPKTESTESPLSDVCSECGHPSEKHYGSKSKWCNEAGCTCQVLR